MCAASISDRSASQRDSGHCSGYHAAPSSSEGEYGVVGTCAATGTDKEINKATQIATFLNITVFSILSARYYSSFRLANERCGYTSSRPVAATSLYQSPESLMVRFCVAK